MLNAIHRIFIGLFIGQVELLKAEKRRCGKSMGVVAREIMDLGIEQYKKKNKLPATYPSNAL